MDIQEAILSRFEKEVNKARNLLEIALIELEDRDLLQYLCLKSSGLSSLVYELSFKTPEYGEQEETISEILGTDDFDCTPGETSYYIDLNP